MCGSFKEFIHARGDGESMMIWNASIAALSAGKPIKRAGNLWLPRVSRRILFLSSHWSSVPWCLLPSIGALGLGYGRHECSHNPHPMRPWTCRAALLGFSLLQCTPDWQQWQVFSMISPFDCFALFGNFSTFMLTTYAFLHTPVWFSSLLRIRRPFPHLKAVLGQVSSNKL